MENSEMWSHPSEYQPDARVGITAVSHKVISNLLEAVVEAADETGLRITCAQKVTTRGDTPPEDPRQLLRESNHAVA